MHGQPGSFPFAVSSSPLLHWCQVLLSSGPASSSCVLWGFAQSGMAVPASTGSLWGAAPRDKAWPFLGEEQDLGQSHGNGWRWIPVNKPTSSWKTKLLRQQNLSRLQGWFTSRVKCQNKPRAWGYDSKNVFAVFSVPEGSEAKFLSELGLKKTLHSCISKQKHQAHP